ncbi:Ig-like domain-containing protein [Paenibacillus oenotherae]|uniref:Ig-like domain-containing protein n=1 Tax=Paenibacillus oenotherae TaxID=1435645 RepID=A0ABS7DA39_9BACL|nr:Ig-like domain-containing protein [Paenibacillus oenotherae]MBW7476807.1 Ig-like domain-containing protein [Paenibacillus oenotherae]
MKRVLLWLLVSAMLASLTPSVFDGKAYAAPSQVKLLLAKVEKGCPSGCYEFSGGIEVDNIGYQKEVYVHYTTGNGQWYDIPASYAGKTEANLEGWVFNAIVSDTNNPIRFAIKYNVNGQTYWDNNNNQDYQIGGSAPDRVLAKSFLSLDTADFGSANAFSGRIYLKNITHHKKVTIRYTTDNWASYKEKDAVYGSPLPKSNNSLEFWDFNVDVAPNVREVRYIIAYVANGVTYWDNNYKRDHVVTAKQAVPAVLTLTPQSQSAAAGTNAAIRVRLTDSANNPVKQQTISLTAAGNATLPSSVTTDNNGEADVLVTSQQAGTVTVTGSVNGYSITGTAQITFVPENSSYVLTLTPQTQSAAAGTNAVVRLRLTDRFNNAVKQQAISLTATGNATLPSTVTTNSSGEADVSVTSQQAGTVTVTGKVPGSTVSGTAQITFTPDNTVTLKLTPQSATAVVGTRPTVRVRLTDKYNNPVRQAAITMSATGSGFVPASLTTDNNGEGAFLVGGVQTGTVYISATATGYSVTAATQIVFTPDLGSAVLTLIPEEDSATAGTGTTVRIRLTDQYNNPIRQTSVQLSGSGGVVLPASVTTNSNGEAVLTVTSEKAGNATVTASFNGITASAQLKIIPDVPASLTAEPDTTSSFAGAGVNIRYTLKDRFGNSIPNATISLSATGNAVLPASITTDASGRAELSVMSEKAGTVVVTATVDRTEVAAATTIQLAPDQPASVSFVAQHSSVVVGTSNSIQAIVTDRFNNPVPNVSINLSATGGADLPAVIKTDHEGKASAAVTSQQAGNVAITGTVNDSSVSGTIQIGFTPDDQSVNLTLTPQNITAVVGMSTAVGIRLTDKLNNPLANTAVQLAVTGNPLAVPSSLVTNANGEAVIIVTSQQMGTSEIKATFNEAIATARVILVADDPSQIILTPASDSAVVGTNAGMKFRLTDRYGNPVSNRTLQLQATGEADIPSTVATDENGEAVVNVTSQKVGNVVVTAAVEGSTVTGTASVSFTVGEPALLTLTPPSSTAVVGKSKEIRLRLTDRFGNIIPNASVGLTATGTASLPASVTTDHSGEAVFAVSSVKAGSTYVAAAVTGTAAEGTARIQFTPEAPAKIIFQLPLPQLIVDEVGILRATLVDKYGNGIPNQTLNLTATKSLAVQLTTVTNANGEAIIILGNPVAETATVTAKAANGVTGSATITSRR